MIEAAIKKKLAKMYGYDFSRFSNITNALRIVNQKNQHSDFYHKLKDLKHKIQDLDSKDLLPKRAKRKDF